MYYLNKDELYKSLYYLLYNIRVHCIKITHFITLVDEWFLNRIVFKYLKAGKKIIQIEFHSKDMEEVKNIVSSWIKLHSKCGCFN